MTDLLTPGEVRKLLGLGTNTLARWRERGFGPAFVKAGPHVLYERAEVEAFATSPEFAEWAASPFKTGARHGTVRRYRQGCRCDDCRAAKAEKQRRTIRNVRARAAEDPSIIPHGTTWGYHGFKCRCEECRAADRANRQSRRG